MKKLMISIVFGIILFGIVSECFADNPFMRPNRGCDSNVGIPVIVVRTN